VTEPSGEPLLDRQYAPFDSMIREMHWLAADGIPPG
jgi:hypothetical protein